MSNRRVKKNRIGKRDAWVCGTHLGGCMKRIEKKEERTLDHIIPQSFFRNPDVDAEPSEFNGDWNLQVMHADCNVKHAGFIHELPVFQCPCHYFQVLGQDLYIVSAFGRRFEKHKLLSSFAFPHSDPKAVGIWATPVSQDPKHWPKGTLRIDRDNNDIHYLISINESMIDSFNGKELARVQHLSSHGKARREGVGPIPVVFLNGRDNVNFDFTQQR